MERNATSATEIRCTTLILAAFQLWNSCSQQRTLLWRSLIESEWRKDISRCIRGMAERTMLTMTAGIEFAILRAGFGRLEKQKDEKFEQNYENAKAAGIPVGAYWYSYAMDEDEARLEADVFLKVIKGKQFEILFPSVLRKIEGKIA